MYQSLLALDEVSLENELKAIKDIKFLQGMLDYEWVKGANRRPYIHLIKFYVTQLELGIDFSDGV